MKKGVPISPDDIPAAKAAVIPPEVFDAWNEVITKHYTNGRSHFNQVVIADAVVKATGASVTEVYGNKWLDVEDAYRAQGWNVEYDRPAYCDTYEANFTFTKK